MRKVIIFLFALILSFTAIGCTGSNGCSCTAEDPVSYYVNWAGGSTPATFYKEVATYKVTYTDNFNENNYNYKKVNDINCNMTLTGSTYVVTTEVITKDGLPANVNVDNSFNGKYYKITTDLSVKPSYTIGGQTYSFNDKVTSTVYFYDETFAFAPIYSVKDYDTTNISLNTEGYAEKIIRYVYTTETLYNGGNITFKISQPSQLPASEGIVSVPTINTQDGYNVKGDFKKFIDNEELLFACRNISLSNGETFKVVSPSYLNVEEINATNLTDSTTHLTIKVNDSDYTEVAIPTSRLSVLRSAENNTGSPILADIQRSSITIGDVSYNNAFMVKMITRLPSHIGALVYTLDSVVITK